MSRKLKTLSEILRNLINSTDLADGLGKGRLLEKWESLVGPSISAVSRPIDVRGDTLLLEVEDPVWRSELSLMQEHLLETINGDPELPEVSRIRFIGRRSGGKRE